MVVVDGSGVNIPKGVCQHKLHEGFEFVDYSSTPYPRLAG